MLGELAGKEKGTALVVFLFLLLVPLKDFQKTVFRKDKIKMYILCMRNKSTSSFQFFIMLDYVALGWCIFLNEVQ